MTPAGSVNSQKAEDPAWAMSTYNDAAAWLSNQQRSQSQILLWL